MVLGIGFWILIRVPRLEMSYIFITDPDLGEPFSYGSTESGSTRLTLLFVNNIIPCSSCSLPPPPLGGQSFHTCHMLLNFWKYKYWNLNTTADTIQGKCKCVRLIKWKHHFTNLSSCTVEIRRKARQYT